MIQPALLPPEARITINQSATANTEGLQIRITGTGWVPPDFGEIDWSQPQTLEPIGPVPGNPAQVSGRFEFQMETDLENQQVRWSISSSAAQAGETGEEPEEGGTEVSISLLSKGWSILRAADGTAIPMVAYSKRQVTANGTGTPPVAATPLSTISFAGIDILVTDYQNNTTTEAWSISGEET